MNKLKWTMLYRWAGGVLKEWLGKAKPGRALANESHADIRNATGRELRILLVPLGNDPRSKLHELLVRRTIRKTFGPAAKRVTAKGQFAWNTDGSVESITRSHARAQQLLKEANCDVLVVRRRTDGTSALLQLVAAANKAPATYAFLDRFDLPVPISRKTRAILAARLFVACTHVIPMGQLRFPPLQRLIARLPQDRGLGAWALANIGFLHLLLGEQTRSIDDLKKAAGHYRRVLTQSSRDEGPLAWARMKHDQGTALRRLGERDKDITSLRQSVEAFRAALSERTRERAPLQWAATQSNLGLALTSLVLRKKGDAIEAIAAFQAALTEWTLERAPVDWADLQNHLGRVLLHAGERGKEPALLEQAAGAFRAAIGRIADGQMPPRLGALQHNLGNALLRLADYREGTAELRDAVAAFRAAQTIQNRHTSPEQWSGAQNKIGQALAQIGTRENDKAQLQQAIAVYRDALKVRTRRRMPALWAATQADLGAALLRLSDLEANAAHLREAAEALQNALGEKKRDSAAMQWAALQAKLGDVFLRLAGDEPDQAYAKQAAAAFQSALEVYRERRAAGRANTARRKLAAAQELLNERSAVQIKQI